MLELKKLALEDIDKLEPLEFWTNYSHLNLQELHTLVTTDMDAATILTKWLIYLNKFDLGLRHCVYGDQYWDGTQWQYYTLEELVESLVEDDYNYIITMSILGLEGLTLSLPSCLKTRLDYKPLQITIANAIKKNRSDFNLNQQEP